MHRAEFARLQRLVPHFQCTSLLAMAGAPLLDQEEEIRVLQGRNVYQAISDVISYTETFRSLRQLVGSGNESAGYVMRKRSRETWLDVPLSDCFMQTGGIWVSCMTDRSPDDVFIATAGPDVWHVLARHSRVSDRMYVTDVFVFDSRTGALTEAIMGTKFSRIPKTVMCKLLGQFAPSARSPTPAREHARQSPSSQPREIAGALLQTKGQAGQQSDIAGQVRQLLLTVSGIEPGKIHDDAHPADLGVDSLMAMELAREIEAVFRFSPDHSDLLEATTVDHFTSYISSSGPGSSAASLDADDATDSTGGPSASTPSNVCSPDVAPPSTDETDVLSLQGSDDAFLNPQEPLAELKKTELQTTRRLPNSV
ncbi:hypothetical protein BDW62DRAFT_206261 [Aspergillus aurantiobrunneus]